MNGGGLRDETGHFRHFHEANIDLAPMFPNDGITTTNVVVGNKYRTPIVIVSPATCELNDGLKTAERDEPTSNSPTVDVYRDQPICPPPKPKHEDGEMKGATRKCSLSTGDAIKPNSSSSSLSSCASVDTTTDDNLSDYDEEGLKMSLGRKPKGYMWSKIRRAIIWSPFVQTYKRKYPWIQLTGHQGCFKAGSNGTIRKKVDKTEIECLEQIMSDVLRPYVPEYRGTVVDEKHSYVEMQDLLAEFENPSVMDCKIGIRTYLEIELAKARREPKLRKDMYQKMVAVDPTEPTAEEHEQKGLTKPRYMQWREQLSSTSTLGFRIEGIKKGDQKPSIDFKKTKSKQDVSAAFSDFINNDKQLQEIYTRRLRAIRATLESSDFFHRHEVVGSSLLFVHDRSDHACIWMIDFGKTTPLPKGVTIDHRSEWIEGNHEDGYLSGLDNMIGIMVDLVTEDKGTCQPDVAPLSELSIGN